MGACPPSVCHGEGQSVDQFGARPLPRGLPWLPTPRRSPALSSAHLLGLMWVASAKRYSCWVKPQGAASSFLFVSQKHG